MASPAVLFPSVSPTRSNAPAVRRSPAALSCSSDQRTPSGYRASRAVVVSVAGEVAACRDTFPGFFAGYFDGKASAEKACADCVQDATRTTIVKPSFIYGGDEFGLLPP